MKILCNESGTCPSYYQKTENKKFKFYLKAIKTITIRLTAIAVLLFASLFLFANRAEKETNEFAITPVENLHLGKSVEKVRTISYSEQEKPVTIVLRSIAHGK